MLHHNEFQLWQFAAMPALAVLGAAAGAWCVRAARAYARLLGAGFQPDGASMLAALRISARPKRGAGWAGRFSAVVLGAAFMAAAVRYGYTPRAFMVVLAAAMLMLLAHIDGRTRLLPDALTLPLLWLALAAAWAGWGVVSLPDAVAGAMAGYGFLWALLHGFRMLRGVQGMGHGDLKLLAALGAWMGWQVLPWVLLAACVAGIVFAMLRNKTWFPSGAYPFGPFLAVAAVAVFIATPELHLYFY